jgi:flagellar hook protein FlgE
MGRGKRNKVEEGDAIMSIFGAMVAGVSGLAAQSQAIGMISDNIANMNTDGYKGVNAAFSTLVTQAAGSFTHTPGGVLSNPIQSIDQQGLLQSTTSSTDVAIAGNGFFVVSTAPTASNGEYLFTRAGSFRPDENGDLVNTGGYYLQGWPLDSTGALPSNTSVLSSTQTINITNLSGLAGPTTLIELGLNLPSTAAVGDTHSSTIQIFDSLGNAHNLQIDFTKTATNAWDITVNDPALASSGATSGTTTAAARSITFNGDGTPATITFPDIAITGWNTPPTA